MRASLGVDTPRIRLLSKINEVEQKPMAIDKETVRKVARLARIAEPEERLEPLAKEISGILGWIEQLNEVDVEGVEAMASTVDVTTPMRADALQEGPTGGGQPENVVANAPKTEDHFFVVPRVVE
ncbi:MAG: aspartyl/glutamyl-tRNA(Asn/Gln) amidotransferase subunit C [Hyphococcus sp.]|nr:MAG: aspartyl/glutamyl-tRNA(Asn/Gln) amidotransferase subunit C [Marinicaulis sp.]